jgi:hypothetical protein
MALAGRQQVQARQGAAEAGRGEDQGAPTRRRLPTRLVGKQRHAVLRVEPQKGHLCIIRNILCEIDTICDATRSRGTPSAAQSIRSGASLSDHACRAASRRVGQHHQACRAASRRVGQHHHACRAASRRVGQHHQACRAASRHSPGVQGSITSLECFRLISEKIEFSRRGMKATASGQGPPSDVAAPSPKSAHAPLAGKAAPGPGGEGGWAGGRAGGRPAPSATAPLPLAN